MTPDQHILALLLQSAVRSALLGAVVYLGLKLFRLRDLRTETAVWTVVLLIATATPLLTAWAPGLVVRIPLWAARQAGAPLSAPALISTGATGAERGWRILMAVYVLVAAAGLLRLGAGLLLSWRLCARAESVAEPWTLGRDVRVSAHIDSPLSLAGVILLPPGYEAWPEAKLAAVLAHEESHIRRGDFFIQLLAAIHRALFWFSPFAWWLQLRLGELAETASDAAAMQRIADPAGYAEILVEVTRSARRSPTAALAMARGPGVAKRVEHILSGIQDRALGAAGRTLALAMALLVSLGFAEVRAATAPDPYAPPATPLARAAKARPPSGSTAAVRASPAVAAVRASRIRVSTVAATATPATPVRDQITYDPRALLEDSSLVAGPGFMLAGPVGQPVSGAGD